MQDLRGTVEVIGSVNNDGHYYTRDSLPIRRDTMQDLRGKKVDFNPVGKEEEEPALNSSMKFARKNSMRNKPYGCGSGKKFKKCCWSKFNGVTL